MVSKNILIVCVQKKAVVAIESVARANKIELHNLICLLDIL